jgi:anti-sigma factor RsiW
VSAVHDEIVCRQLVELVTDYLEGALPADVRVRLEEHLAACGACRLYVEQMRDVQRAAGTIEPGAVPAETRAGLLHAFRDWSG